MPRVSHKKAKQVSICIWITSILLFIAFIIYSTNHPVNPSDVPNWVPVVTTLSLGLDILVGFIAFCIMIAELDSEHQLKQGKQITIDTLKKDNDKEVHTQKRFNYWAAFSVLLLIILAFIFGKNNVFVSNSKIMQPEIRIPTFIITPTPTQYIPPTTNSVNYINTSPKIDCVGPDGKHLSVTQKECDHFNNAWKNPEDQIVNCRMQPSCGGQIMQLTKKECNTIVCCEVDGKWSTYPDNSSCDRAQRAANPVPTYKSTNWTLYFSCTNSASSRLSTAMSSCYPYISLGDNVSYELCKNTANNNYNADMIRCESYK